MQGRAKRGVFIVVEGIDRSGKSTQVSRLANYLEDHGRPALRMAFPDRSTPIGQLLGQYLKGTLQMSPHALHLLFSANRWEHQALIESTLASGRSIVCDRYSYSGVVYSWAAQGLDWDWCLSTERGLIEPDVVIQLDADPVACSTRSSYGEEAYEKLHIQTKVREGFGRFQHLPNWIVIPCDESLQSELQEDAELLKEGEGHETTEDESDNAVDHSDVTAGVLNVAEKVFCHLRRALPMCFNEPSPEMGSV